MIRIVATLCFSLTLLCPVFCLAGADAECSDHGRSDVGNCEAMSVGAVVAEPEVVASSFDLLSAALLPAHSLVVGSPRWSPVRARNRANVGPSTAATRRALLQSFLF